ncbi:hypothetical protein SNEBB_005659 [Seison nebaliae]|nr:hypothetical protein SNEBB_005659 [Seison nebaliae]
MGDGDVDVNDEENSKQDTSKDADEIQEKISDDTDSMKTGVGIPQKIDSNIDMIEKDEKNEEKLEKTKKEKIEEEKIEKKIAEIEEKILDEKIEEKIEERKDENVKLNLNVEGNLEEEEVDLKKKDNVDGKFDKNLSKSFIAVEKSENIFNGKSPEDNENDIKTKEDVEKDLDIRDENNEDGKETVQIIIEEEIIVKEEEEEKMIEEKFNFRLEEVPIKEENDLEKQDESIIDEEEQEQEKEILEENIEKTDKEFFEKFHKIIDQIEESREFFDEKTVDPENLPKPNGILEEKNENLTIRSDTEQLEEETKISVKEDVEKSEKEVENISKFDDILGTKKIGIQYLTKGSGKKIQKKDKISISYSLYKLSDNSDMTVDRTDGELIEKKEEETGIIGLFDFPTGLEMGLQLLTEEQETVLQMSDEFAPFSCRYELKVNKIIPWLLASECYQDEMMEELSSLRSKGKTFCSQKENDKALFIYKAALKKASLVQDGKRRDGETDLENEKRMDELRKLRSILWNNISVIHKAKNNIEEALKACNQAVELDEDHEKAYYRLMSLFIEMKTNYVECMKGCKTRVGKLEKKLETIDQSTKLYQDIEQFITNYRIIFRKAKDAYEKEAKEQKEMYRRMISGTNSSQKKLEEKEKQDRWIRNMLIAGGLVAAAAIGLGFWMK